MLLPFICLLALLSAFGIARCLTRKNKEKRQHVVALVFKMVILMVLLLFPGLSQKIFTVFKCKQIDGIDGVMLLEKDVSVVCHAGEHLTYTAIAVVFLIVCKTCFSHEGGGSAFCF